jgi:predicted nucleic acid-binding protein
MSEEDNRIYVDTNVLYYWLFSKNFKDLIPARKFMKDIESGKYKGIISDLTLNELKKVIRTQLVNKGITDPNKWKATEDDAITKIYQIKNENVEIVSGEIATEDIKIDEPFSKVSDKAYTFMSKYSGKVIRPEKKEEHKGLSTVDTFHLVLAQNFKCNKIASFDGDFHVSSSEMTQLDVKQEYTV